MVNQKVNLGRRPPDARPDIAFLKDGFKKKKQKKKTAVQKSGVVSMINLFMPNGLYYLYSLYRSTSTFYYNFVL